MEEKELTIVAARINEAIVAIDEAIDDSELSIKDLDEFESYLSRSETLGPLFNPNLYAHGGGFTMIDMARKRVEKLRYLMEG